MSRSRRAAPGWARVSRLTIAATVLVAAGLAGAPVATADVEMRVPNALSPVEPEPGEISPQWEVADGIFSCNSLVTIANKPSGYAIGNCPAGSRLYRTARSEPGPDGNRWDGGWFDHIDVWGCGWINWNDDTEIGPNQSAACPNPTVATNQFAYVVNCQPGACTDGTPVAVTNTCWEFANVRPWTTPTPAGYVRARSPGEVLLWRYIVGGPGGGRTDSNGTYWVMVRDPYVSPGQGNWVFVSLACFNWPPPPHNNDPAQYYYPQ